MSEKKKSWPECLGDTVDEIAESLRKQGARGIPKDCRNCIIVRSYYLQYPDGWSGLTAVWKQYRETVTQRYGCKLTFNDIQIMDPIGSEALGEFMYRFDNGEYPELLVGAIPTKEEVLSKLSIEERIAINS